MRVLTAIPVYNEVRHVERVLAEVKRYADHVAIIDDGSTDGTSELLLRQDGVTILSHGNNRGYGAAIVTAFRHALAENYDALVTMDCDGQHEPSRIPLVLEALDDCDIASGSRYLRDFRQDGSAPEDRRLINQIITSELNAKYHLNLTDAFCGFKAYRREALARLRISETSWGMPLQLWVQAAKAGLRIQEVGVPRLYLDPTRAFGGVLNDAEQRLAYYRDVIARAEAEYLPCDKLPGVLAVCCAATTQPGACS